LAFAKESNPRDEFFVVNFNNGIYYGLPNAIKFTDKLQLLRRALYFGEPNGQTALYDAIASALKHLELSDRELRTLIVVSDGGDNVSKISLQDLMRLIESSRATIYTIGLLDPDDRDLNPKVLRRFASVSGGEFFEPSRLEDVVPLFEKISADIRNRYTIGFIPDEVGDKHKLRSLKVTAGARGRKFIVRTRSTYSILPVNQNGANPSTGHVSEK
jgi:Ca-activated chloride channel homolog